MRNFILLFLWCGLARGLAAETVYFPPTVALPPVLVEFNDGKITAEDFRFALRDWLRRNAPPPSAVNEKLLQSTLEDMATFANAGDLPLGAKFYGWDNEVVMTVNGRDFTWNEAIDLFLARVASADELARLFATLTDHAIIRNEAARILERAVPETAGAIDALRQALAPLLTKEALLDYYASQREKFLVLKIKVSDQRGERTIYAAPEIWGTMLPITEYGVDYLITPAGLQSPLAALPAPVLAALTREDELVEEDIAYRVAARLYPRQPAKLLSLLASLRLQNEIARLLTAVKENQMHVYWQPQ
ncbi:MAG: hypothetical protein LBP75_11075 [Planctomycetota bacterium]|jgi:hypothetical protein|nr:hypothetical protein [Planctomycetota bacterium]